jgi:hypothetical protein
LCNLPLMPSFTRVLSLLPFPSVFFPLFLSKASRCRIEPLQVRTLPPPLQVGGPLTAITRVERGLIAIIRLEQHRPH